MSYIFARERTGTKDDASMLLVFREERESEKDKNAGNNTETKSVKRKATRILLRWLEIIFCFLARVDWVGIYPCDNCPACVTIDLVMSQC